MLRAHTGVAHLARRRHNPNTYARRTLERAAQMGGQPVSETETETERDNFLLWAGGGLAIIVVFVFYTAVGMDAPTSSPAKAAVAEAELATALAKQEEKLENLAGRLAEVEQATAALAALEGKIEALRQEVRALPEQVAAAAPVGAAAQPKAPPPPQTAAAPATPATDSQTVTLAIAESGDLIPDRLRVVLSHIYEGDERVRVYMAGKLLNVAKESPTSFRHEGAPCRLHLVGISDGKAELRHECF